MKKEILHLLKNNTNFISGQDICERLKVSRTAIWKNINLLKEDGYTIESVSNKGYRLVSCPDILTSEEVKEHLTTKTIGQNIFHFDTIDSTNKKAKELAESGVPEGTIIVSEEQTSGRGRLGRSWVSPKSKGIWMSVILRPHLEPVEAAKLTQVAAAAVVETFKAMGITSYVKWPNDIVVSGKKVCGILTEMSAELTQINYIIVGIGINANLDEEDFPEEIKKIATSLKLSTKASVNRQAIFSSIINNFELLYYQFVNNNNISETLRICRENSIVLGKEINIIKRDSVIPAIALDIDEEGRLLVEYTDGKKDFIVSGEVSIRGKDSYI